MRLWRRNEAPVGGWYYLLDDGTRIPKAGVEVSLEKLIQAVEVRLESNNQEIPDYLEELVEDQICTRQPEGKCRYTKSAGDRLSLAITSAAGIIDSALGTSLKKSARSCSRCGQRRVKMNNL